MIIPSPGIPGTHPIYATGKVVAEMDFVAQYVPKNTQLIAVTGTDGKSTTAWMLYSILKKAYFGKKKVYLSGNFGTPFSATVQELCVSGETDAIIVLEVSSFMAHWIGKGDIPACTFDYSIVTNIQTDHLNWHRDLQEYIDAKMQCVMYTRSQSIVFAGVGDFIEKHGLVCKMPDSVVYFSLDQKCTPHNWTDGERIIVSDVHQYYLSDTTFSGVHNALNLLSVLIVMHALDVDVTKFSTYLPHLTGLPHRIELIGQHAGIRFVDDSKSTSAQSLQAALGAFGEGKNILLIAGGSDKGDTFDHLLPLFQKRVFSVACIGATKQYFVRLAKEGGIIYKETDDMQYAVDWLLSQGREGDVLLLSPGCASFGLFHDYEDRARAFREALHVAGVLET